MKKLLLAFAFLGLSHALSAGGQDSTTTDHSFWFNFYFEKSLYKGLSIHLNNQNRWDSDISTFRLSYADVGLTYKLKKGIKFLADYVYVYRKEKDNRFYGRQQFYGAVYLKHDINKKWNFTYRNLLQFELLPPQIANADNEFTTTDRNKLVLNHEFTKHWAMYVAEELYIPLFDRKQQPFIDRNRSFVGAYYNINKHHQIELYFMLQETRKKTKPEDFNMVIGLGYSIDI